MLARAKRTLLPSGARPRQLRVGLGRGLRMELDFAHETRMYLGMYEVELNRHLRRLCRPGTTSFDVGAQQGYDALVFAKLTGARVESFERDAGYINKMHRTLQLNEALQALVQPVHANVGTGLDGSSVALDDLASCSFMPDFVKIDVEGAELDVLHGAERLLHDRGPAVIIEVHSLQLERECGRLLVDHGYRPLVVSQRTVWRENRSIDHNRWLVAEARVSRTRHTAGDSSSKRPQSANDRRLHRINP